MARFRSQSSAIVAVAGLLLALLASSSPASAATAAPFSGVAQADAGIDQTCAVKTNGTVWCWGDGSAGQLGNGTRKDKSLPTRVKNLTGAVQVSTDEFITCAVRSDGTVWCWGFNSDGQLGDGTRTDRLVPVQVKGLAGASQVAAGGGNHVCALKGDESVWCWGVNTYGQLGDGTHVTRTMPVRVHNLTQVVQLEVKQDETCARLVDGTIWCWGANDLGELGDGTTTNRSLPTKVQGIPGPVNQFQMSGAGACASNAAGLVWCWGANFDGQLGDGTTDPHLSAVEANVTDVAGVAPADGSTCVRTKALTALCWGADDVGQLGTGGASGVPYLTPQPVEDLAHARGLTGGGDHVCAVVAGGTMYCWGSNGSGQLGEGFLGGNQVNPTLVLS